MPWLFAAVLDILEGVGIRSIVVLQIRAADCPTATKSLLLADI
jgi:hypothetical protein